MYNIARCGPTTVNLCLIVRLASCTLLISEHPSVFIYLCHCSLCIYICGLLGANYCSCLQQVQTTSKTFAHLLLRFQDFIFKNAWQAVMVESKVKTFDAKAALGYGQSGMPAGLTM